MKLELLVRKGSLFFLICLGTALLWISIFPPRSAFETQAHSVLQNPSIGAWFGTDSLGRDLFFRILLGAQVSLLIGICSCLISLLIGFGYGGISAMLPRHGDSVLMRFIEILMALPRVMVMAILYLVLQSYFHHAISDLILVALVLSLGSWMPIARITRNLIRSEKTKDYIEGAQALGATPARILFRHLLPNVAPDLLLYWSLQLPQALLAEGMLSFLGFGVKSPHVSWGILLQEGWRTIGSYPHLLLGPCLILSLTIFSLNILLRKSPQTG